MKTLTENVRNMFIERFEESGIDYSGLRIGSFVNVGLECPIPTLLVFENIPKNPHVYQKVVEILFNIVDTLNIEDKYDDSFDLLLVTSKTQDFNHREDLEEF